MNAIQILRQMHADTKVRFKVILGSDDSTRAAEQWVELQALLELHEQLEDDLVYAPVLAELGPGTPLGDWSFQHEADVAVVEELIVLTHRLTPATPEWRNAIGSVMDVLNRHVTDEEGQIFGPIEQLWGPERLAQVGQQMDEAMASTRKKAVARS